MGAAGYNLGYLLHIQKNIVASLNASEAAELQRNLAELDSFEQLNSRLRASIPKYESWIAEQIRNGANELQLSISYPPPRPLDLSPTIARISSLLCRVTPEVSALQDRLLEEMFNPSGALSNYLKNLSDSDKVLFLSALINNNADNIYLILKNAPGLAEVPAEQLKQIIYHKSAMEVANYGAFTNTLVANMIAKICQPADGAPALTQDKTMALFEKAMRGISDHDLPLPIKKNICQYLFSALSSSIGIRTPLQAAGQLHYSTSSTDRIKRPAIDWLDYLLVTNKTLIDEMTPAKKHELQNALDRYDGITRNNTLATGPHEITDSTTAVSRIYELLCREPAEINIARVSIDVALKDGPNSPLSRYLSNLPTEKKAKLISALISNDRDILGNMLSEIPTLAAIDKERLNQVAESGRLEYFLNPTVVTLIKMLVEPADGQTASPAKRILLLERAIGNVPDGFISTSMKKTLYAQILPPHELQLLDYAYHETAKIITTVEAQKHTGKISPTKYKTAIQAELDYSEFILLTLGVLKDVLHNDSPSGASSIQKAELNHIRRLYMARDYENAITKINEFCVNHREAIGGALADTITLRSPRLNEVNRSKNYPRRFFETRLGQTFLGQAVELERINRICLAITGVRFETDGITPGSPEAAQVVKDAVSAVIDFCQPPHYAREEMHHRYKELSAQSEFFRDRVKTYRPGFHHKSLAGSPTALSSPSIHSRNRGVMVSNQPSFGDEITQQDYINKTTDKIGSSAPYSPLARRSAFAGNISGHAYGMVARLEKYMQLNRSSPTLEDDVNHFIKAFMSDYTSRGSHSFFEVFDAFNEPAVLRIFADCGVRLNLEWSDELLEQVTNASQDYTAALVLRRTTHTSLSESLATHGSMPPLHRAAYKGNKVIVEQLLNSGQDPNESEPKDHNTPLHVAAMQNHPHAVKILLSHPHIEVNKKRADGMTPLHLAVKSGHLAIAHQLLHAEFAPANPNILDNSEETPLLIAVRAGRRDLVELLLKEGADPNVGKSPLLEAFKKGDTSLAMLILEHGGNPNVTNNDGMTALHLVIENPALEQRKLVQLLLQKGAINTEDTTATTPLRMAIAAGLAEISTDILLSMNRSELTAADKMAILSNKALPKALAACCSIQIMESTTRKMELLSRTLHRENALGEVLYSEPIPASMFAPKRFNGQPVTGSVDTLMRAHSADVRTLEAPAPEMGPELGAPYRE
ncbi:substrate of the Dot/Icm secretion system [Legionella steelei]|uniref:Substrate of the Dot/Icm secretion system n=1 Tax=Legionella steelei TaxID=947033 RepID=A0A0W0ZG59_9GAMM|nr:ankyrin repeat domain-containing protein [Legionella steelei]KTD67731.1 substrate of the Dot/Icm secretion system [Legionella steelei]